MPDFLSNRKRIVALNTQVIARRCYVKKVFLELSQNSLESTCGRVRFLIKLKA